MFFNPNAILFSRRAKRGGYLMLLALVFGAIFVGLLGALSSYVLIENRLQGVKYSQSQAFTIAEAGIEYYRWFLAHYPGDTTNGTGHAGPFVVPYNDPEGGQTGTITLGVTGNTACGQVTSIDLESEGVASDNPLVKKTVLARYARPSVGTYSYILNDSVWAGADRVILGPYHSNGGIHMDGSVNSLVSSSVASWNCTSSYGCGGSGSSTTSQPTAPGVLGNGTNQNLWEYPTPQVDFSAISADFNNLKTTAQSVGLYLPRYSTGNDNGAAYWKGYHLIFNANGTVTVRHVTSTTQLSSTPVNAADDEDDVADRMVIANETNFNTYTISPDCGLIFVEDNTWVEGTIPSKITLVVANTDAGIHPSAYLRNNIVYGAADGSDGFTLIAERNVLVTPDSPQNMTLHGIFIAQGGAFGRNLYGCPGSYEPKGTLTILGTTVSNKRTGTKWVNGCYSWWTGYSDAGYQTRIDSYDRRMASDPPPFTPLVSADYQLMDWREE
ncbi:MAG: hypothetical protein WAV21_01660 [Minisyncoccia bacterium]